MYIDHVDCKEFHDSHRKVLLITYTFHCSEGTNNDNVAVHDDDEARTVPRSF